MVNLGPGGVDYPVIFNPKEFGEPSPTPPPGYYYGWLGGNFTIFRDGKRVPSSRFLIPLSGCLFDAEDKYSRPGIIRTRLLSGTEYWDNRYQQCACPKCHTEYKMAGSPGAVGQS